MSKLSVVVLAVVCSCEIATYTLSYNVTVLCTCRSYGFYVYAEVTERIALRGVTSVTGLGSSTCSLRPIVTERIAGCCLTSVTGLGSSAGSCSPIVTERITYSVSTACARAGAGSSTRSRLHAVAERIAYSVSTARAGARAGRSTCSIPHNMTGYVVFVATIALGVIVTGCDIRGVVSELISTFLITYGTVCGIRTGSIYPYVVGIITVLLLT